MKYFKISLRDNKSKRDYGLKTTLKFRQDIKRGVGKE